MMIIKQFFSTPPPPPSATFTFSETNADTKLVFLGYEILNLNDQFAFFNLLHKITVSYQFIWKLKYLIVHWQMQSKI